jgi:hypothetical protein
MSLKIPLHSYLDFSPANAADVRDEHGEKVYYHNISTMGKHDLGELNPNMLVTIAGSFREKLQKYTQLNHWNIFSTAKVNVLFPISHLVMLHETENNVGCLELVVFAGLFSFHIRNGTLNKSKVMFTATFLYEQCSATVNENDWLKNILKLAYF